MTNSPSNKLIKELSISHIIAVENSCMLGTTIDFILEHRDLIYKYVSPSGHFKKDTIFVITPLKVNLGLVWKQTVHSLHPRKINLLSKHFLLTITNNFILD